MLDIMLPYWGDPIYLTQAVDSILAQDSDQWRLTIIDDHYPDTSVAEQFAENTDPRIRFLRNEQNLGVAGNFQRCLDLAQAELMMVMGSDDLLAPGYVRTVTSALRRFPDAAFVQPGVDVIDAQGEVYLPLADRVKRWLTPQTSTGRVVGGERLAVSLLRGDWLYWPSLTFRTAALKQTSFQQQYSLILDVGVLLDLVARGEQLVVLSEVVFQYRRHRESASSAGLLDGPRFADERTFFNEQAERFAALGWRRAARAARGHLTSRAHALTLLPEALKRRSPAGARTLLRHAVAGW